jgi:diacylglycerol O-acyltransferase / wax synthase
VCDHRPVVDERKMSDAEGLMWRLEKDPQLGSTFGTVSVLDRPPDFDALRARMERATYAVPRLRWRVQPAAVNLSAPSWVDDPDFDLDNHVRRIALPKPGSMRQLLDLCTLLVNDSFDRLRPLWQFTVIEGLRGGKAALLQKMHHTITDGEGGIQMSLQFLDFERDAPPPGPIDELAAGVEPPPPPPSAAGALRDLVAGSFRLPIGVARQVTELMIDPTAIPTASAATVDTIRGVLAQLSDVEKAHSPLWTQRSLRRRFEVVRAPFRATKDSAKRLGGTLNTAFLTAAADAASRYHEDLGAPVEHLRTTMAVSTRTSQSETNAFSLARVLVPTGPMPIAERFEAIEALATEARGGSGRASLQTVAAVAAALPTSLVTRLARQQSQTVDFATSNVKGSPMPVYIAGAKLLENYPMGPLAGVAFNLTLLSYAGSLDVGLNIDAAAVAEPERLAKHLDGAFADLRSA